MTSSVYFSAFRVADNIIIQQKSSVVQHINSLHFHLEVIYPLSRPAMTAGT